jgi:flagellar biosynthetic protein FliQ
MDEAAIASALREMIVVVLKLGGPVMLAALTVGIVVSLLQAITQINEATLAFVPKAAVVIGGLFLGGSFFLTTMSDYMHLLIERVITAGR